MPENYGFWSADGMKSRAAPARDATYLACGYSDPCENDDGRSRRVSVEDHDPTPSGFGEEALGPDQVTLLLQRCAAGEPEAFQQLVPLVYDDLHRIAHLRLRSEQTGHTLDTTALVHEAYLALVDQATATWQNRAHFFAVAARAVRNVLVDYSRRRGARKRDWGVRVPLRDEPQEDGGPDLELLALDVALRRLGALDARLEQVVECRFFGGMTVDDTAEALGVSRRTVERDWTRARAYLYRQLAEGLEPGS